MNDDNVLTFAKARLEEGEGISPDALAGLLDFASRPSPARRPFRVAVSLAASLALVAGGWFFLADFGESRRERDLTDVIDLLCILDDKEAPAADSLADHLLAWQDAPTRLLDGE